MGFNIKKVIIFPIMWRSIHFMIEGWDLTSKNKNVEAERVFERGESIFLRFSNEIPYEFRIMKGYIKFKLEKWQESYDLFKGVWREIEGDDSISNPDKLYLKEYMYGIIDIYHQFLDFDISFAEPIYPKDVPLKEVSKQWKVRFPSRDHPDWHKCGV